MKSSVAAGLIFAFLFYGGLAGLLWLAHRREKERYRREKASGRLPERRTRPLPRPRDEPSSPAQSFLCGMVLAFLPLIVWFLSSRIIRNLTPPSARIYLPPSVPLSDALILVLVWWLFWGVMLLLLWALLRLGAWFQTDPVVERAFQLDREGDHDGAIRVLRDAIEARGPSAWWLHALADLLLGQERWPDAYKVLLDLEARKPSYLRLRQRKSLTLWKMGQPEAAVALFERPLGRPHLIPDVCTYCQALTDLGLYDRAWEQLRRAETIFARGVVPPKGIERLRGLIDACRARLAEHFPEKKAEGLDEL